MEIAKSRLYPILRNVLWGTCVSREVEPIDLQWSIRTLPILCSFNIPLFSRIAVLLG